MSELCEVVELCQNWFLKLAVSVFQKIGRSVSNAQARSQLKIQMVGASNREYYVSVYASFSSDICHVRSGESRFGVGWFPTPKLQ